MRGNQYNLGYFNLLRRNVEGGPRISDLTHTEWRGVVGARGDLDKAWSYDAYFQYGHTDYEQVYRNEFSTARLNRALNVVNVDPATGQVVPVGTAGSVIECRAVLDNSDPNCFPYDIFGTPTAAAVELPQRFRRDHRQDIGADRECKHHRRAWRVRHSDFPWSDEGVGINFGTEYRKELLNLNPDQEFQTRRPHRSGRSHAAGERGIPGHRSVRRDAGADHPALVHRGVLACRRLPQVVVQDDSGRRERRRRPQFQHQHLQALG